MMEKKRMAALLAAVLFGMSAIPAGAVILIDTDTAATDSAEHAELDLYGTVDAAVCSLDGMNYIPAEELPELFHRLHLFIRRVGLLIFYIRAPVFLRALDGDIFVDEKEDVLCLWRADFDEELSAIVYGMDIFSLEKRGLWSRESEEHIEYAHTPEKLRALLETAGFGDVAVRHDCPQGDAGRIFITAKRK